MTKANGISIRGQAQASPASANQPAYAKAKQVQMRLRQHRRVCMYVCMYVRARGCEVVISVGCARFLRSSYAYMWV